jgi:biotin carboxyl carrier protein
MDIAKIEELIHIVKDARVSELTLHSEGSSITVKKAAVSHAATKHAKKPAASAQSKPAESEHASDAVVITAPMVGIFHATNSSAKVGAVVKSCQTLGAIESMKLMSDVLAQVSGTIAEVAVEDGAPVEYGQTLFRLESLEADCK